MLTLKLLFVTLSSLLFFFLPLFIDFTSLQVSAQSIDPATFVTAAKPYAETFRLVMQSPGLVNAVSSKASEGNVTRALVQDIAAVLNVSPGDVLIQLSSSSNSNDASSRSSSPGTTATDLSRINVQFIVRYVAENHNAILESLRQSFKSKIAGKVAWLEKTQEVLKALGEVNLTIQMIDATVGDATSSPGIEERESEEAHALMNWVFVGLGTTSAFTLLIGAGVACRSAKKRRHAAAAAAEQHHQNHHLLLDMSDYYNAHAGGAGDDGMPVYQPLNQQVAGASYPFHEEGVSHSRWRSLSGIAEQI